MQHREQHQGDEIYCNICGKRWDASDDAPQCTKSDREIIGFCGHAGSGKTTLAHSLVNKGYTSLSFAQPIREMLLTLYASSGSHIEARDRMSRQFKEAPDPLFCGKSPRYLMQTLGTEWGRTLVGQDLWVNIMRGAIASCPGNIVIDDVRFEDEASLVRELGGRVIMVTGRRGIDSRHISENGVEPDSFLDNDGPLALTELALIKLLS